jgi:hypothetical protein
MKRIAVAVLSLILLVCAAPAFARHKKPHKDPRSVDHPKAYHEKNQHFKHQVKHKVQKHTA